jgi:hypothetical protein
MSLRTLSVLEARQRRWQWGGWRDMRDRNDWFLSSAGAASRPKRPRAPTPGAAKKKYETTGGGPATVACAK